MSEFQAGDILECIRHGAVGPQDPGEPGKFYRCASVDADGGPLLPTDTDLSKGWAASRFRLAFRPPEGEHWEPWNGGEKGPDIGSHAPMDLFCNDRLYRGQHSAPWDKVIAYRVATEDADLLVTQGWTSPEFKSVSMPSIAPGDPVFIRCAGRVLAIHGDLAWVKFDEEDEPVTIKTAELERGR